MAGADGGEEPIGPPVPHHRRVLRVELDITTMAVVGIVVFGAFAVAALFEAAPATITRIAIALLFALALDPLVVATARRLRMPRRGAVAVVGTAFGVGLLLVVLVVGPAAVTQAQEFGEELPQTLEGLYDIPLVGSRLQDANAADRIREWIDGLPGELDADVLSQLADTFVGGIGAALTVIMFVVAILLDGEVLVARMRNLVPPSRRPAADRLGQLFYGTVGSYFAGAIFVAVLDGVYVLTLGLILGVPLAPVAGLWAMITNLIPQIGGFLGGSFFVLLAFSAGPTHRLAGPRRLRRLHELREQRHPAGHHRAVDEPLPADHDGRGPHRRRRGRGARGAGGDTAGRHGQGHRPQPARRTARAAQGEAPVARQAQVVPAPAQSQQGRRDVLSRWG